MSRMVCQAPLQEDSSYAAVLTLGQQQISRPHHRLRSVVLCQSVLVLLEVGFTYPCQR